MEAESLVELWKRARARGEDVYLATVVHVQGLVIPEAGRTDACYLWRRARWNDQWRLPGS